MDLNPEIKYCFFPRRGASPKRTKTSRTTSLKPFPNAVSIFIKTFVFYVAGFFRDNSNIVFGKLKGLLNGSVQLNGENSLVKLNNKNLDSFCLRQEGGSSGFLLINDVLYHICLTT